MSDNTWAKPGKKCVCINDSKYKVGFTTFGDAVVKGNVLGGEVSGYPEFMHEYTVGELHPFAPFMTLVEISHTEADVKPAFPIEDFRPLEEIEDDNHIDESVKRKERV